MECCAFAQARHEALRRDQRLRGLEGQGLGPALPLLARPRVIRLGLFGDRLRLDREKPRVGQVLPGGEHDPGNRREELRQLVGQEAALEALYEGQKLARLAEARAQALGEACQHGPRREGVREGEDLDRGERALAALARGVEAAQALDRVAEELDPHRALAGRREHVQDAAAARHLAGCCDGILLSVARLVEGLEQHLGGHLLALAQGQDASLEELRCQRGPQQASRGSHHGAQTPAGGRMQGGGPAQAGVRMAREATVGARARSRERKHLAAQACCAC